MKLKVERKIISYKIEEEKIVGFSASIDVYLPGEVLPTWRLFDSITYETQFGDLDFFKRKIKHSLGVKMCEHAEWLLSLGVEAEEYLRQYPLTIKVLDSLELLVDAITSELAFYPSTSNYPDLERYRQWWWGKIECEAIKALVSKVITVEIPD